MKSFRCRQLSDNFIYGNSKYSCSCLLQIKIAPKAGQHELKEDDTKKESEEINKENEDIKPYATVEEINNGRLPPEEILSLPMFKVYLTCFFKSQD